MEWEQAIEKISRRRVLFGAAACALASAAPRSLKADPSKTVSDRTPAFVGSYTGAVGNGGNGAGIYALEMDAATGELTEIRLAAEAQNPSWIAIHPSGKFLYAVNEVADGRVTAFAIDITGRELRKLNQMSSEGVGPAYMTLDRSGRFAFVANYGDGSVAVIPIRKDGMLGKAVDTKRDGGSVGQTRSVDGPPGNFAISGHDGPHAHMIAPGPENRFVFVADLGQDRIYCYRFDATTGKLSLPGGAGFISLPQGDGPRHFAFHPNGEWLYSIQEEASTVVFLQFNSDHATLTAQQTVSTLPPGFAGTSFASEILISPSGLYLYAANRLHDTIAAFAIGDSGRLTRIGEASTMGDYPSQCAIDPSGRFLYACNRRSDCITCFRIDSPNGLPIFTGEYTPIGSPACIAFLKQQTRHG